MSLLMSILWGNYSGVFYGLLGVCVTLLIFFISTNSKKPMYFVSKEFTLAENNRYSDHLKMLWDNQEVKNIKTVNVIFYNDGKLPIRKNDISIDYPISINRIPDVSLLSISVREVSRKELKLDYTITEDSINLQLNNDEAFEQGDGFVLQIIYSTELENIKWTMNGRIFGVKQGIREKSSKLKKYFDPISGVLTAVVVTFLGNYLNSLNGNFPKMAFSIVLIVVLCFGIFLYFFYKKLPKWLRKRYTDDN